MGDVILHQRNTMMILKEIKPAIYHFKESALPFIFWGLLPGLVLPYLPEIFQPKVNQLWLESIAHDTILTFLYFSLFSSGLFLLVLGAIEEGEKFANKLYEWLVRKPIYFGITFTGVAFGLLLGVGLAVLIHGYGGTGLVILVGAIYMFAAFIIMWILSVVVKKSILKPKTNWHARLAGFVMLLLLPVIAYMTSLNNAI